MKFGPLTSAQIQSRLGPSCGGALRTWHGNHRWALPTISRAELTDAETSLTAANDLAVRRALEAAGVEFIDENGGGPGVRLRKSGKEKPRK